MFKCYITLEGLLLKYITNIVRNKTDNKFISTIDFNPLDIL